MDVEGPGNNRPNPGPPGSYPGPSSVTIPEQSPSTNYTIPGILHFIKHEWSRFEKERATWEVQKTEIQAKISFLQGERKGHESLMHDLIRRIKMLEYALKQERVKLYKAVHGKDLVFADMNLPPPETENNRGQVDISTLANHREESRKMLREYLREVGFPDNVLEARVARMTAYRSLYGQNQMLEQPQAAVRNEPPTPPSLPSYPLSTSPSAAHSLTSLPNGPVANGTDMQVQGSALAPQHDIALQHTLNITESDVNTRNKSGVDFTTIGSTNEVLYVQEPNEGGDDVNAVFHAFEFLNKEDSDEDDEDEEEEEEEGEGGWIPSVINSSSSQGKLSFEVEGAEEDDKDTESALDEFQEGGMDIESTEDRHHQEFTQQVLLYAQNKPRKAKKNTERPSRQELKFMAEYKKQAEGQTSPSDPQQPPSSSSSSSMGMMRIPGRGSRPTYGLDLGPGGDTTFEAAVLGELAVISIEPDTTAVESSRKWEHKYTLQSHFDVVTSIAFHPTDQVVLTGSEDCTLKIWNLQRARQKAKETRRSMLVDVEALQTLRGHRGHVLSVAFGIGRDVCYSGSADSTIRVWQLPAEPGEDPFDLYDPDIHQGVLTGHSDAVWNLAVHPTTGLVLSCAADASCRLWNHTLVNQQVREFITEPRFGNPTSVDFVSTNLHQMVVSYTAAKVMTFDLETGQSVLNFDSGSTYDGTVNTQINKVLCHPTLPIVVSAHEDKYIKFYDTNSGKLIHYMTAHMDAVAGLAIDPHGLYLLSGGHDGSLRFWSMDSKMCIQEIGGAHRKRFDEAIRNLACHSTEPFFASAGADGIAKVYM